MGSDIPLIKEDQFDNMVKTNNFLLIDLYADWCDPCKEQGKILSKGLKNLIKTFPSLKVLRINSDEAPKINERFEIRAIPQLIGVYNQNFGIFPAGCYSIEEITDLLQKLMEVYNEAQKLEKKPAPMDILFNANQECDDDEFLESVDPETLAKVYHEVCREMVDKQIGMITKPTQPYIEWDKLTEEQKKGRLFIATKLLEQFHIIPKEQGCEDGEEETDPAAEPKPDKK